MSCTRDEHSTKTVDDALSEAITTDTTTVGASIDTQNYESLEFVGHASITDGTYTFVMEESSDDGATDAWAAVDSDFILFNGRKASPTDDLPTLTVADDDTWFRFGYVGKERNVRLSIVSTSTTSGGTFTICGVKEHFRHQATAEQPAA